MNDPYKYGVIYIDGKPEPFSGNIDHYNDKNIHRDNDLPAISLIDGSQEYWKNNKRHRGGDKPAIIRTNGEMVWFKNGIKYKEEEIILKKEIER